RRPRHREPRRERFAHVRHARHHGLLRRLTVASGRDRAGLRDGTRRARPDRGRQLGHLRAAGAGGDALRSEPRLAGGGQAVRVTARGAWARRAWSPWRGRIARPKAMNGIEFSACRTTAYESPVAWFTPNGFSATSVAAS